MAAGDGACHRERQRRDHRAQLRPGGRGADHAGQRAAAPARARAGSTARYGREGARQRRAAARRDRQRGQLLPQARQDQDARPGRGADLGRGQQRRHRPRALLRRVRQPHPRTRRPHDRAAQLGHRGDHLSLAAAGLGGRASGHQPGLPPDHLRGGRRAGARTLAPARRRLPPPARRLGRLRRARRGRHQLLRRRPRHHRRRLPARPHRQRPLLCRTARGPGHRRLRRQRQPPARVRQHARRGRSAGGSTPASVRQRRGRRTPGRRSMPRPGSTAPANAKAAPAKAKPAPAAAAAVPGLPGTVPGLPGAAALAGTGGIPGAGPAAGKAGTGEPAKGAVPGVLATSQLLGQPVATTAPEHKPAPASAPANVRPAPARSSQPAARAGRVPFTVISQLVPEAVRHAGDKEPAGIHQPGRARRRRRPAALRRARVGDDRPGDRGVRLGPEQPRGPAPQPVRHQGHRARRKRHPAD